MVWDNGVNVCGFITGDSGLGQSARNCINALRSVGVLVTPIGHPAGKGSGGDNSIEGGSQLYDTTIVHINPDMASSLRHYLPMLFGKGKRVIAYWHWELEELPPSWVKAIRDYDEVWAPSRFVANAIRKATAKPVHVIPHAISVSGTKRDFGLRESAVKYLTAFDPRSIIERKNPMGVLKAFSRAFIPSSFDAQLVIKCNGITPAPIEAAAKTLDAKVINGTMSRQGFLNLIASCDVYVSLHRSEGYGLPLAEAMAMGKACIGTGWSGNLDFMNDRNAMLVDYNLQTLDRDIMPYLKGQRWAEPSIGSASLCMQYCYHSEARDKLGRNASQYMLEKHGLEVVGMQWRRALQGVI